MLANLRQLLDLVVLTLNNSLLQEHLITDMVPTLNQGFKLPMNVNVDLMRCSDDEKRVLERRTACMSLFYDYSYALSGVAEHFSSYVA